VLGWLLAHASTDWLLTRTEHHRGNAITHGHLHLSAAVLLVACLAGGSMLAVFIAALAGGHQPHPGRSRSKRSSAHRSSLLSTVAFVAAEFAEHALTGEHDVPPVGVLLLGGAVHALLGAASAVVWRHCLDEVLALACAVGDTVPGDPGHRIPVLGRGPVSLRRTWRALALAGRAPPRAFAAACR
jgi:hypothetical protein